MRFYPVEVNVFVPFALWPDKISVGAKISRNLSELFMYCLAPSSSCCIILVRYINSGYIPTRETIAGFLLNLPK